MQQPNLRVIISGGGTGGHIFPAIAIANAIKKQRPDAEILFIGAKGRMEMEKVPAAGYKIEGLWISGLQRKLTLKNLMFPAKVISSIWKSRSIIKQFNPDVAIGVGGYASGPMLRVASTMGIPCLIQEQNSFPGITNKLLAKKVDRICVAYDNLERFFPREKMVMTGNPVRNEILNTENKYKEALEFFNLNEHKPIILFIGGSLGARGINKGVESNINWLVKNGAQVIWQTGKPFYNNALEAVKQIEGDNIRVYDFISRMDLAYSAATLVVSRAGAIAISELCCVGKPVILVPSPFVAEDHQTKNAQALVNKGAAIMIKDDETTEKLPTAISELLDNKQYMTELKENIKALAKPDAADHIASEVLNLINKR